MTSRWGQNKCGTSSAGNQRAMIEIGVYPADVRYWHLADIPACVVLGPLSGHERKSNISAMAPRISLMQSALNILENDAPVNFGDFQGIDEIHQLLALAGGDPSIGQQNHIGAAQDGLF